MYRGVLSSGLGSHWRREVLRTSLWFVPALEVVAAQHLGVPGPLGLIVAALAVLISCVLHTAISRQLPQVSASTGAGLAEAIREQGSWNTRPHPRTGPSAAGLMGRAEEGRAVL